MNGCRAGGGAGGEAGVVLPQHALHCCWGAAEQGIRQGTNDVRQRWQRDCRSEGGRKALSGDGVYAGV